MAEEERFVTRVDKSDLHDVGNGGWLGVGFDAEYGGWRVERYIESGRFTFVQDAERGEWRVERQPGDSSPPDLLWRGTYLYRDEQEARDKVAELAEKWRKRRGTR